MSRPGCIVYDGTQGQNAYTAKCLGCGQVQRFVLPMPVNVWCAAVRAFEQMHRGCRAGTHEEHGGGLST